MGKFEEEVKEYMSNLFYGCIQGYHLAGHNPGKAEYFTELDKFDLKWKGRCSHCNLQLVSYHKHVICPMCTTETSL